MLLALCAGQGMLRALRALHVLGFAHRGVSPLHFGYPVPLSFQTLQKNTVILNFSLVLPWPRK